VGDPLKGLRAVVASLWRSSREVWAAPDGFVSSGNAADLQSHQHQHPHQARAHRAQPIDTRRSARSTPVSGSAGARAADSPRSPVGARRRPCSGSRGRRGGAAPCAPNSETVLGTARSPAARWRSRQPFLMLDTSPSGSQPTRRLRMKNGVLAAAPVATCSGTFRPSGRGIARHAQHSQPQRNRWGIVRY